MGTSSTSLSYGELPSYFQDLGQQTAGYYSDIMGNAGQTNALTSGLTGLALGSSGAGSQYLSDVLSGKYTDFSTNEALQSAAGALTNEYTEGVNQSLTDLNRQAQSAGQFFSGASSAANTAATDTLTEDYLNQLGELYNEAYTSERGYQQDALSQLQSAYTNALTAQGLGSSGVSSLLSSALGGGTVESGFGLK